MKNINKKKFSSSLLAILLVLIMLIQTACDGNNSGNSTPKNTAPLNTATFLVVTESLLPQNTDSITTSASPSATLATSTGESTVTATAKPTGSDTAKPTPPATKTPTETAKPTVTPTPTQRPQTADEVIASLTLEEKVAQLFIVVPYALTGIENANAANSAYKAVYDKYPVGGFCYMENSIESEQQVKTMLKKAQQYSLDRVGVPLFACIDEEGGKVARLANSDRVSVPDVRYMSEIGKNGTTDEAKNVGLTIGKYLKDYGFNVNFAPVADVLSDPDNVDVHKRSFGSDKDVVTKMTLAVLEGLHEHGIYTTLKHFPGNGSTKGDTHLGFQYTNKTLDQIKECELVPFADGIKKGTEFIMVGHVSLPNVIGDNTPASLSKTIITDLLRNDLGYDGIIITDALNMGAITQYYGSEDAVIKAFLAGADMLLMPNKFEPAYNAVLEAVKDGTISEQRLNESLKRIFEYKLSLSTE